MPLEITIIFPKRLFAVGLFAATLFAHTGVTRAQWVKINGPYETYPLLTNSIATIGGNLVAGTNPDGIYLSTNDGDRWSLDTAGIGSHTVQCFAIGDTEIYAGTYNEGIFFSTDSGVSWDSLGSAGMDNSDVTGLAAKDGNILAYSGNKLYLSTNHGQTWTARLLNVESFSAVGDDFFVRAVNGIFLSSDGGTDWTREATDTVIPSLQITGTNIIIDQESNEVSFSTNNGVSWVLDTDGIGNETISCIAAAGTNLFIGTINSGIYLSTNLGARWKPVNDGLTDSTFSILHVHGQYLFGVSPSPDGFHTNFWRRPFSDFGISSVAQTAATLLQIRSYPNPFSNQTTITLTSETHGYADVRVVNQLGVEVARLYSGELSPGEHSFVWSNPTGLPFEAYECVVGMNGQMRTIPLCIAR